MIKQKVSKHPLYRTWVMMRQRCSNPNAINYRWYGGKGVTVCERWLKFENFVSDMGARPDGHTLDRIDSEGNYELANCRWATQIEQKASQGQAMRERALLQISVPQYLQVTEVAKILEQLKSEDIVIVASTNNLSVDQVLGISKHYR